MSVRVMAAIWEIPFPPTDKLVFLALADAANDEGLCWPSIATVARKSGVSERSVQRAIREGEKCGLIERDEVKGKGCRYRFNPRHCVTPDTVSPPTERHHTPDTVSPKPSKNHQSPTKATPSTEKRARQSDPFPCPEGVDPVDWRGLIANRKAKRAALSEGAHRGIVRKLTAWAEAGWPPGPIVANAAERGWTSVFETDEMKGRNHGHPRQSNPHAGKTMSAGANVLARYQAAG